MEQRQRISVYVLLSCLMAAFLCIQAFNTTPVSAYSASITTGNSITLDVSPAGDGTSIHSESINVQTDCRAGYNLTIDAPYGSDLYRYENNAQASNTASFTAVDGVSALNNSNNTNKWGYTLESEASSSSLFYPLSSAAATLKTTSQTASPSSDINDVFSIYYGIQADGSITPGNYQMANNGPIVYYLTMDTTCSAVDIAYDGNNANAGTMGASGTGVIHTGVKDGDEITLIASNFSRSGYGFAGWSTDPNAGTKLLDNDSTNNPVVYGPQETVTLPTGFTDNDTNNDGIVELYAVWLQSQGNLQGWMGCSSLDTTTYDSTTGALDLTKNSVTALTDQRDNDTYAVARLADGNCWMIENLRLDNTASHNSDGLLAQGYGTSATYGNFGGLADAESSGFINTYTANSLYYSGTQDGTASINIGTTNYPYARMPRYNNWNDQSTSVGRPQNPTTNNATNSTTKAGMYSYGNYYTWHAAIADLTYNGTTNQSTTSTSLCPSGWHLPQGGDKTRIESNDDNDFWDLTVDALNGGTNPANYGSQTQPYYTGTDEARPVADKLRTYPNNFLYSGYFNNMSVTDRGSSGVYWSSTAYGSTNSINLFLSNSYVYPGTTYGNKYQGRNIRCIASDPQNYTLTYDANSGSGAPSSQTTTANGIITFTISNTIPTRSGYTFVGWTDEKGNEAQPNASFITNNPNTTLYAIWTNNSCNPTATTIGTGNATTDAVCLQDVKPSMKASLPTADATTGTYTLIDARDNQNYTIAKLSDGELWMTKNLNYSSTNLNTSHDTDIMLDTFRLPQSTTTSSTDDNAVTIRTTNNSGNNDNGTYYSWPAAIANTGSYSSGSSVASSICPKGWDLPIAAHYNNLNSKSSYTSNRTDSAPSSFLIDGGFTNGATFYGTSYGHFWTSTSNSTASAYGARANEYSIITNASTGTTYGGNKYYRKNIRCIASSGTATIRYDANGGTGTMTDQVGDINALGAVKNSSFTAPANSQFRNWNTSANGTGTTINADAPLSSIVSDGDTVTLYAQWDEVYYIAFNANGGTGTMTNQTVVRNTATAIKTSSFTRTGHVLVGWNTSADGNGTFYVVGQTVTNLASTGNTITLYAVWMEGALLDAGTGVNQKLKRLAGNSSATNSTQDTSIRTISRASSLPADFTPSTANTISASSSPSPIYAWYSSGTIYYYSEATNIIMNTNSNSFFYQMRALYNLSTISTWKTTMIMNMNSMFYYTGYSSSSSFSLNLSSWDTSNVTNMSSMFYYAGYGSTSSFNLNLSSWDTSNVTNMYGMFYSAGRNATSWTVSGISSWNTSNVTNMGNMFSYVGYKVSSTFSLNLSSWNTSKVTNMSSMFVSAGYSASTFRLYLSSWNTSNVTSMSGMFTSAGNSATTWSITIPKTNNGTTTGPITNTTSRFYGKTSSVSATPRSGKSFTLAN